MKRRSFLGTTGGFIAGLPFIARAKPRTPEISEDIQAPQELGGELAIDMGPVCFVFQGLKIKAARAEVRTESETEDIADVEGYRDTVFTSHRTTIKVEITDKRSLRKIDTIKSPAEYGRFVMFSRFMDEEIIFLKARITGTARWDTRLRKETHLTFSAYPQDRGRDIGILWRTQPRKKSR